MVSRGVSKVTSRCCSAERNAAVGSSTSESWPSAASSASMVRQVHSCLDDLDQVRGRRVDPVQQVGQLGEQRVVVGSAVPRVRRSSHHASATSLGSCSTSSRRSRSRQRARVGPMLPIGMSMVAATSA